MNTRILGNGLAGLISYGKNWKFARKKIMVDARRDFYIVHVDGYYAALKPYGCAVFRYGKAGKDDFREFCEDLIKDFPTFRFRCVQNKGIEDEARRRIKADKELKVAVLNQYRKQNGGKIG